MKHREPVSTDRRRLGWGLGEYAEDNGVGISLIKRAVSWGNIRVVYFGDRPIITAEEAERISREGLGRIPDGYKPKGQPRPGTGRPRKAPTPTRRNRKAKGEARDSV